MNIDAPANIAETWQDQSSGPTIKTLNRNLLCQPRIPTGKIDRGTDTEGHGLIFIVGHEGVYGVVG